jgi:26S proteasome regulatory subunit T4
VREDQLELKKNFQRTENNLKSFQSVGQMIGEILKQLDDERCKNFNKL